MILVVGGTGRLGGKIVDLLRRDQPVRVMTRNPSRAGIGWDDVDVVAGDLRGHNPVSFVAVDDVARAAVRASRAPSSAAASSMEGH